MPEGFTRAQALRAVGLSERQLKQWEKVGLMPAVESYGVPEIVALRTLARLKASRVSTRQMQATVAELRQKLGEVKNPLSELKLERDGRRIRVQFGSVLMEAGSGQLLLDFTDAQVSRLVAMPRERREADAQRKRREAVAWFERGVELEQTGAPAGQAMDAYRVALALDPGLASAMVNLGTLHFTARDLHSAEKYYRRAIETNPEYPLAHFNLGNLYDDRGDSVQALRHYQAALELDDGYADAHYNVALLYQVNGQTMKAVHHWRKYLSLDPRGHWADIARRELHKLYDSAVVSRRAET